MIVHLKAEIAVEELCRLFVWICQLVSFAAIVLSVSDWPFMCTYWSLFLFIHFWSVLEVGDTSVKRTA